MTCQELDLWLAYEKRTAEVSQTGGGKTFIDFLRMYKEIHKEKEEMAIHLRDAEHTEEMAGTLILMCDSDPGSDPFIAEMQRVASEERERALSQVCMLNTKSIQSGTF